MAKLTKSQRKKASHQNTSSVTLQQQNNTYHLGASEIESLQKMQDSYPHIVEKILSFRKKEIPFIRSYAFLCQFMAYSLGVASLAGGAYYTTPKSLKN